MILNGALAGLVSITAGADVITGVICVGITGFIGGILVVLAVLFIDKNLKLDDPVGATSVHLICGIWGTLAVGIFGGADYSFIKQFAGVAYYALAFPIALALFYALKAIQGKIRVQEEEEIKGLDLSEHSMEAYEGFQIFNK